MNYLFVNGYILLVIECFWTVIQLLKKSVLFCGMECRTADRVAEWFMDGDRSLLYKSIYISQYDLLVIVSPNANDIIFHDLFPFLY